MTADVTTPQRDLLGVLIAEGKALTVAEVRGILGGSINTHRRNLHSMQWAGLIRVRAREGAYRGRPPLEYSVTAEGRGAHYRGRQK